QWVDRDTTTLLADVMRAPDPPPLLLVLATRADKSEPVLELVRRMDAEHTLVDVGPLPEDVAVSLAISQLADGNDEVARRLVREAVLGALPTERRAAHHRALAIAMSGQGTAEQLARHWYGAGDLDNAAPHARKAGDEARAKLDFDLSARWYAIALEGTQWTDD